MESLLHVHTTETCTTASSFKLQAYGNDGTQYGKYCVRAIIKSDVAPYTNWIWGEVSEAIEHYFKKFDGYPLLNSLVAEVLKKNSDDIELSKDGFHYKRKIGKNSEATEKVVYGFPSQDVADRAMASANYEIKRHKLNMQLINEDEDGKKSFRSTVHVHLQTNCQICMMTKDGDN